MLQVTAERTATQPQYQVFSQQVILHNFDKLTPHAARAALEVAFGNSTWGRVWAPNYDYGYQVYEKSTRKIYSF